MYRFIPCVGFVVLVLAWDSEDRITEALVGAFSNYTCMCKEDSNSTPERQHINDGHRRGLKCTYVRSTSSPSSIGRAQFLV